MSTELNGNSFITIKGHCPRNLCPIKFCRPGAPVRMRGTQFEGYVYIVVSGRTGKGVELLAHPGRVVLLNLRTGQLRAVDEDLEVEVQNMTCDVVEASTHQVREMMDNEYRCGHYKVLKGGRRVDCNN